MELKEFFEIFINLSFAVIFLVFAIKFGAIFASEYQKTKEEERNLLRAKSYKEISIGRKYQGGK